MSKVDLLPIKVDGRLVAQSKEVPFTVKPREKNILDDESRDVVERIGYVCQKIIIDPESNMSLLKKLLTLDSKKDYHQEQHRRLLLLSLCQVFLDIIPGYRIQILSEKQQQEKTTKETLKMRQFEQSLVRNYKVFLDLVRNSEYSTKIQILLLRHCHFNYSDEIISLLCQKLFGPYKNEIIQGLKLVFLQDNEGSISYQVVVSVCRMLKKMNYSSDPVVLDLFLSLRLKQELKPQNIAQKKTREFVAKRERKRQRVEKELKKVILESDSKADLEKRTKIQLMTLERVFCCYLSCLKQKTNLVSSAISGFFEFGHLISLEFFPSLFELLKTLKTLDSNLLMCRLIKRAKLNVDMKDIVSFCFELLLHPKEEDLEKLLEIVMEVKYCSLNTAAAFFLRLLEASTQILDSKLIYSCLETASNLCILKNLTSMFDGKVSKYKPYELDPEMSMAISGSVFILNLLTKHYDPKIREISKSLIKRN